MLFSGSVCLPHLFNDLELWLRVTRWSTRIRQSIMLLCPWAGLNLFTPRLIHIDCGLGPVSLGHFYAVIFVISWVWRMSHVLLCHTSCCVTQYHLCEADPQYDKLCISECAKINLYHQHQHANKKRCGVNKLEGQEFTGRSHSFYNWQMFLRGHDIFVRPV